MTAREDARISVVVVSTDGNDRALRETTQSVNEQRYTSVECLVAGQGTGAIPFDEALDKANGELIVIVYANSLLMPNAISQIVALLECESEATGLYCDQILLDDDAVVVAESRCRSRTLQEHQANEGPYSASLLVLRREALNELGRPDGSLRWLGVYDLWLRAMGQGKLLHSRMLLVGRREKHPRDASDLAERAREFGRLHEALLLSQGTPKATLSNLHFWIAYLAPAGSWLRFRSLAKALFLFRGGLLAPAWKRLALIPILLLEFSWPVAQLRYAFWWGLSGHPYKGRHYTLFAPDLLD